MQHFIGDVSLRLRKEREKGKTSEKIEEKRDQGTEDVTSYPSPGN